MSLELQNFFKKNRHLSDNSISTYKSSYNKLITILGDSILKKSNAEIIKKIKLLDFLPNSKDSLITIAILIKKNNNKSTKTLDNYKKKNQEDIEKYNENKNKNLSKTLPSKEEILNYLQELADNKDKIKEYIVNYLLVNFNTRNQDLYLDVITNKKDINDKDNFLYQNKKTRTITFIRNNYKTEKTYGKLENKITDKYFYEKINQFLNYATKKKLLDIKPTSVNQTIKRMTYNNISSGKYMKIFSSDADKKELNKISKNRGTSVNVILSNYVI